MSAQQPTAIVPLRRKTPQIVQFAADGVAADMRVESLDRRRRTNLYVIRLASSDDAVTGRLIGVLSSGDAIELGDLAVAPGSIGSASLAVATPRGGYRAVHLEIRSDRVLLQLNAPKPPARRHLRPLAAAAGLLTLGAVSLGAGALALALPQPPVLSGPEHATVGDIVHVQYATRGYGAERYTARYDDGVVFASGALVAQNGELALSLPSDAVNRRVWVAVTTQGFLGAAASVTSFAVVPPPRGAEVPARVLSFAARRDPGPDGETVLASYLAVADRGVVALQDETGKVIATAPFTHVGTSRLPVAAAYSDRPLTARVSVERGQTHANASVALPAPPRTAAATDAPAPPHPLPAPIAPRAPSETAGMLTFEASAVAGSELAVRVMPHRTAMTVAMQDADGETLSEREIAPGATSVTLPMPDHPAVYFLLLRYDEEDGVQTVVRPVRAVAQRADQQISR